MAVTRLAASISATRYAVLDMTHAQHVTSALHADATSCEATQLQLAADLFAEFGAATAAAHARTRILSAALMREDLIVELASRIAKLEAQLAASAAPAEAH